MTDIRMSKEDTDTRHGRYVARVCVFLAHSNISHSTLSF